MPTQSFNHFFPGYEILGEIGRSNARVLKARSYATGETVAIKHFALNADEDTIRRFQRESEIMTSIKNPNVVKIKDIQLAAELPYIVMELIEGGDLRSLLKANGHLDTATAIRLGLQMAEAFKAIHEADIVHRDIKPENILYRNLYSGELHFLLTDFGTSKVRDSNISLTGTGMITYEYASPEQFNDPKRVTAATDYYSLGVVLYECLTGSVPFKLTDGRLHTHINNVIGAAPPALRLPQNTLLPPSLITLVNGLLEKQPEHRVADYTRMKRLLKKADAEDPDEIKEVTEVPVILVTPAPAQQPVTLPAPERPQPVAASSPPPDITGFNTPKEKKEGSGTWVIVTVVVALFILLYIAGTKGSSDSSESDYTTDSATMGSDTTSMAIPSPDTSSMMGTDTAAKLIDSAAMDTVKAADSGLSLTSGAYSENFDTDDGIWKTETYDSHTTGIEGGKFIINGLQSNYSYRYDNKFNISTNDDFSMFVDVNWLSGADGEPFGIDFYSDQAANSYFIFYISANGSYGISYFENNGEWHDIKDWTASSLIHTYNAVNRIGIQKEDEEISFYINGEKVETHHFSNFYGTDFGFRVDGKQKVSFDDLLLEKLL